MLLRTVLLLAAPLLFALPAQAATADDEAWIARYIASGQAPGLTPSSAQVREITFAQLGEHVGRRVRFVLNDGRSRHGIVESVGGGQVQVRAQFGSGFFLYGLSRSDIRSIQLD
ncbi:hypothetical protein [Denitratimonas sp. CY0512]|uniref:hypothetical protein n=1 Tax=Denitratimonas sp. CY0512 TaxID=3131940 RepID=UPI0030AE4D6A